MLYRSEFASRSSGGSVKRSCRGFPLKSQVRKKPSHYNIFFSKKVFILCTVVVCLDCSSAFAAGADRNLLLQCLHSLAGGGKSDRRKCWTELREVLEFSHFSIFKHYCVLTSQQCHETLWNPAAESVLTYKTIMFSHIANFFCNHYFFLKKLR